MLAQSVPCVSQYSLFLKRVGGAPGGLLFWLKNVRFR